MRKILCSILALLFISQMAWADSGYQIKVQLSDYDSTELYLGYHYGDNQYIKDTTQLSEDGYYIFKGDEPLKPGIYLIVVPPDNKFIQVLVSEEEQHFTINTEANNAVGNIKIDGSAENQLFYDYMGFLDKKRKLATPINEGLQAAEGDEKKTAELKKQLENITKEVHNYQKNLLEKHPKSLTAAIIRAAQEVEAPEFTGDKIEFQRWQFYKEHWFDNLDMTDPRLLRTPIQFQKVDQYMKKLVAQHPDSITIAVDRILKMVQPSEESFQYYLIHFLNEYAKSKIVGMDAVYVHLIDNYYAKGLAPWTEEEQLKKIIKNGKTLAPLLLGKKAPNIKMYKRDGSSMSLYDVKSDFTVLFFWDPDCGHCKKSMPAMIEFYNKFKDRGVKVFAVCTKLQEAESKCWDMIDEKGMDIWINVSDKNLRSRFKQLYDIRTTPQVYVLDENMKILSKRIDAKQLEEVLENQIKLKKKKNP